MLCPACGHDNIAGIDRCDTCMAPLMKLDVPQAGSGMQRRLMEDPISRLEPAPAIFVSADANTLEAVNLMRKHKVGCLLVMEGTRIAGIFSERDLLNKLATTGQDLRKVLVKEVMTSKPVIFSPEDSIRFAIHEMSVGGFRHIPVVNNHNPLGIISVRDVLGYLCRVIQDLKHGKSAVVARDQSQY
jgi:CBS domain-containing protein